MRRTPHYRIRTIIFADEFDILEFGPRVAAHLTAQDKRGCTLAHIASFRKKDEHAVAR